MRAAICLGLRASCSACSRGVLGWRGVWGWGLVVGGGWVFGWFVGTFEWFERVYYVRWLWVVRRVVSIRGVG